MLLHRMGLADNVQDFDKAHSWDEGLWINMVGVFRQEGVIGCQLTVTLTDRPCCLISFEVTAD